MKKLAILNSDPMSCSYGGVAPIMRNMHPYLERSFELRYFYLPPEWLRWPGPHRIKILLYLLLHKKQLKKVDFILSHIPEGSVIASLTSIPYAHVYHGNANPMSVSRFSWGEYFAPIYTWFFKRIERTASLRYTIGPAWGDVKKMMNPITHDIPVQPINERAGFIYAGRLEAPKNIDRIIRVYTELPENIRNGNDLFIAGTGTQEESLKQQARMTSVGEHIHFLGRLDNKDLIREDSHHLLFLMASTVEGMPTAIAEALSVGLPIVATEAGDIPSIIQNGKNGFVLPADCDDATYTSAICQAMTDIEQMSVLAKQSASIFDGETITQQIIDDVNACISHPKKRKKHT